MAKRSSWLRVTLSGVERVATSVGVLQLLPWWGWVVTLVSGTAFGIYAAAQSIDLPFVILIAANALLVSAALIYGGIRVARYFRNRSPIKPINHVSVETEELRNEDGERIKDGYALVFYLVISNGHTTGETLRNLQGRYYFANGEWAQLPFRGSDGGTTDLRHGEIAYVEIGRTLYRVKGNSMPAPFSGGGRYHQVSAEEFRCNALPECEYGHIKISDANRKAYRSIGTHPGAPVFQYMTVILSADDTVSKRLDLEADFRGESPSSWLRIKSGAEQ